MLEKHLKIDYENTFYLFILIIEIKLKKIGYVGFETKSYYSPFKWIFGFVNHSLSCVSLKTQEQKVISSLFLCVMNETEVPSMHQFSH